MFRYALQNNFNNRPFQRGLGRRATFLEDGGLAAKGNPLLTATVEMQLQ